LTHTVHLGERIVLSPLINFRLLTPSMVFLKGKISLKYLPWNAVVTTGNYSHHYVVQALKVISGH